MKGFSPGSPGWACTCSFSSAFQPLIAMLNWVYAYIFRDPKVRVITSEGPNVGRE